MTCTENNECLKEKQDNPKTCFWYSLRYSSLPPIYEGSRVRSGLKGQKTWSNEGSNRRVSPPLYRGLTFDPWTFDHVSDRDPSFCFVALSVKRIPEPGRVVERGNQGIFPLFSWECF